MFCVLLQFSGEEEEKLKRAVGTFCSNQPSALELIKSRQKKDQRFTLFMQVRARRVPLLRLFDLQQFLYYDQYWESFSGFS